jgi:hypothetical protein
MSIEQTEFAHTHTGRTLSQEHRHTLEATSAIERNVVTERGYYTARRGADVPGVFKAYQRKPGLVVPLFSPDGETVGYQLRPDRPRKGGPKYETPGGVSPVVDVHPRMREEARHGSGPLLITEGAKTGDAATSRGVCTVVLPGVWMWCVPKVRPYRLKPCFDHIRLEGREVFVAFDSDCTSKAGVQYALAALVVTLEDRGALVKVVYLPDALDGSKQGIDDYLAAGGTIKEMFMLARSFEPADFGRIRLSRDEKLRALHEDLERRHSGTVWSWRGADADSNLYQALATAARRHGRAHPDGIWVRVSWGTLALEAKIVSSRTVGKGLGRLQERGFLYKDNGGRKDGKSGAFVLVARVKQIGGSHGKDEGETKTPQEGDQSTLHPQSPRLWASKPKFKPTKKMVHEHRLGTRSYLPEPREGITRLAKKRSHAFDRLDAAGGKLTLEELGKMLGVRPYDLTRRKTSPKGRDGLLIWPEEAGIVTLDGDTVSLTSTWMARLEEEREICGEIEADEQAEKGRKRRSRAYREYLAQRRQGQIAASKPSIKGLAAVKRSHEKRAEHIAEHDAHQAKARAAEIEHKRFAKRFVHDRLRALGRIRLELLQETLRDEGGMPSYALPAAKSLGCTVERLPEYEDREFVFAPREWIRVA